MSRGKSELKMRLLRKGAVAVVLFVLAAAQTVLADDASCFVSGTKVNGAGIGGLTVEEARARIESFYASEYDFVISEKGGKTETIKGSAIGYHAPAPDGLQTILDEQNKTGRVTGPAADHSYTLPVTTGFDEGALDAAIQALSCISGSGITVTADAHISPYQEGAPFTIIPEVAGNNVDPEKTAAVIRDAVRNGRRSVDLEAEGCYVSVSVKSDDPDLLALCDVESV